MQHLSTPATGVPLAFAGENNKIARALAHVARKRAAVSGSRHAQYQEPSGLEMPSKVEISFVRSPRAVEGLGVVLAAGGAKFAAAAADADPADVLDKAAKVAGFSGKA